MAPISPSASFLLPINHRGSFFEDAYFQDTREDFHRAVRDVLTRRDRGRPSDKSRDPRSRDLSCYRRLRQQDDFDEDSQALTITEDENNRKILLDVKEFHPDGEVKVHAMSDQELVVDGRHQDSKTGRVRSFSRRFKLPWYADLSCGFFSVDISSDGVLRIVTTKKAPSTGRSIPLILDYQEDTENEPQYENINFNNNNNSCNKRNVAFSMNGSQEEAYNYSNGSVNSITDPVYCSSQRDTMREEPQNKTKEKIIPVVFVKSQTKKESSKISENSSLNQESRADSNQQGSVQSSENQNSSSSNPANRNRPVKTVITTTFEVKPNTNKDIPAKQHEILIPVSIESKNFGAQRTNNGECTKPQRSQRIIPITNENTSTNNSVQKDLPILNENVSKNNSVTRNEPNKELISKNRDMKQIKPIIVEKKKDKAKDEDSSKSKTAKKVCFTILNTKTKVNNTDKQNKDMTKDIKRNTNSKEFIIPLTMEGDSADEKPVQKDCVRKLEIGTKDQKKKNGNKPPINQNKKSQPVSPLPNKISISNIFKGAEDEMIERKSSITSDHKEHKRSESSNNKPPPSPRSNPSNDRKHYRSSSIEDRVSIFTRMSPVAERKSRKDFMDEIRGNGRGARSRSGSVEEMVLKFDKMSPQAERRVLNRKNSPGETTEITEKKNVVKRKESIIPIEIEGETENYNFSLKEICSKICDLNNDSPELYDKASYDEKYYNRSGQDSNEEHSKTQEIKPVLRRRESIIPIKMEYEDGDDSFNTPLLEELSSSDATRDKDNIPQTLSNNTPVKVECSDNISKAFISDHSKVSNVSETENGNNYDSTSSNNSRTKENSDAISYDANIKVNNDDDRVSSISSSSVIEDDNSVMSVDEDSKNTSKDTAKKTPKRKVRRKQSIPGIQVCEDETGETTVLIRGRSSSAAGRKKKIVESVGDRTSPSSANVTVDANVIVKAHIKKDRTANSLSGFSNENISDSIGNEIASNIREITNKEMSSEKTDIEKKELNNSTEKSKEIKESRRSSVLPNSLDLLKIKPPKKTKKEKAEASQSTENIKDEPNKRENTEQNSLNLNESRRASVLPDPSDLIKIKPPKKDKKEKTETSQSTQNVKDESNKIENTEQNSLNLNESRRASVLPDPSDLLKIKLPKKMVSKPNASSKISDSSENPANSEITNKDMSSEKTDIEKKELNDSTEKSKEIKESRRSSVLPNSSDLSKIKQPKKNKKDEAETSQSTENIKDEPNKRENTEQNSLNLKESRRASVLPDPSDLLKIKPPKKMVSKPNASSKISDSSQNPANSESSQDIQKPKSISDNSKVAPPTESEKQTNQTDHQQTQTSINTPHGLVTKDNVNTDKVMETKVPENISENSLNPEALKSCDDNTTKLEPPPTPSLRRKTSFKKYKVFENKRTPSPSPVRRPDSLTSPKTEQFVINKIEENTTSKKEEMNNKKEESLSTANKSKINACVNIENKDMFFSDPFFKDHRQLFLGGVREALKRSGITSMKDKLRVYRELRLKGQTEENQAICSAEDETSYKAVLDMTEFLEGEIKVKTVSSTEIVIEGVSKSGNKSTPFSHSLSFPDSIIMFGVAASISEDGILAINAPKTNPDTEV